VFVNFWKNSSQQGDTLYGTLFCLLVVLHWAVVVECPETDLRMNLKHPPLAVRCNRIVHLFDLGDDAKRLLAESSARFVAIDLTRGGLSCG
jgi:hypothetical protein